MELPVSASKMFIPVPTQRAEAAAQTYLFDVNLDRVALAILSEAFRGSPQSFQSKCFAVHYSPVILAFNAKHAGY